MVARSTHTTVLPMEHANASILLLIGITEGTTSVCTAIVDQQQFEVCIGLPENAVKACRQIGLCIEDGNDDTDFHGL